MLTPSQLKEHRFTKLADGNYSSDEVNLFLGEIIASYNQMFVENGELIRKITVLANKVEEYRRDENNIRDALLNAQRTADSIIRQAEDEADIILIETNEKALELIENAHIETENIVSGRGGILSSAEEKSAQIIEKANIEAQKIISKAKSESEILNEAASSRADEIAKAANKKADEITQAANSEAEAIMNAVNTEAVEVLTTANTRAEALIEKAKAEAEAMLTAAAEKAQEINSTVTEQSKQALTQAQQKLGDIFTAVGVSDDVGALMVAAEAEEVIAPVVEVLDEDLLSLDDIYEDAPDTVEDDDFEEYEDITAETPVEAPKTEEAPAPEKTEKSDLEIFAESKPSAPFEIRIEDSEDDDFESFDDLEELEEISNTISQKVSKMVSDKNESNENEFEADESGFSVDFSVFESDPPPAAPQKKNKKQGKGKSGRK